MVHSGCVLLTFVWPIDCSCMINFIEVPLKGKNKTLSCQNIGGRRHRTTPASQILGGGS